MRALCGAIITAGALIGLGLTALGYGLRYHGWHEQSQKTGEYYGAVPLMVVLIVLLIGVFVGTAIAFMGLMFHHYHRHHELQRLHGNGSTTTPGAPPRVNV
jgi:hypothetical protein